MQVLNFLVNLYTSQGLGGAAAALLGLVLGLSVPVCGYFGAKRSDERLMCCFCGCAYINRL